MKRSLSVVSLSVAALVTLSACGSSSGGDMPGMDMGQESSAAAAPAATAGTSTETSTEPSTEANTGSSSGASGEVIAEHNEADVMFAQMMVPHHRQAVEMSEMILAKDGTDPQVTELAATIKDAQGPEIVTMTGWLEAWGEPMEPEGGMKGHDMGGAGDMEGMSGMMSEDQMAELESAEGVEASRMFLESMTAHHEGAIDMAQDEITDGQNPEAVDLAETIVETQQAEIDEMQQLLATL